MHGSFLTLATVLMAMGFVLLAGCGPLGQSGGGELVGPIRALTTLKGESVLPNTLVTAQFSEDGQVTGNANCCDY